jgi:hypothetical protein
MACFNYNGKKYTEEELLKELKANEKALGLNTGAWVFNPNNFKIQKAVISEIGAQNVAEYRDSLEEAKRLEASGENLRTIEDKTGWYKFEGQWRTLPEEVFKGYKLVDNTYDKVLNLKKVIGNENKIFNFYPQLAETKVVFVKDSDQEGKVKEALRNANGVFVSGTKTIYVNTSIKGIERTPDEQLYTLVHEINHRVQEAESLPAGGGLTSILSETQKILNIPGGIPLSEAYDIIRLADKTSLTPNQQKIVNDSFYTMKAMYENDYETLYKQYLHGVGEIDSNIVSEATKRYSSTQSVLKYSELLSKYATWKGIDLNNVYLLSNGDVSFSMQNKPQVLEAVLSKLSESGLANNVYQMTPTELEAKLLELGVEADVAKQVSVWHGSPYSFDRFTTAAMGTGEGQQTFGWGLYFTDLKGIARNYATGLTRKSDLRKIQDRFDELNPFNNLPRYLKASNYMVRNKLATGRVLENNPFYQLLNQAIDLNFNTYNNYLAELSSGSEDARLQAESSLNRYNKLVEARDFIKDLSQDLNNRNLYGVTLFKDKDPADYYFITWDQPKGEYKGIVSNFIKGLINKYPNSKQQLDQKLEESNQRDYETITGDVLYKNTLKSIYRVVKNNASDEDVSRLLLDIGVDGVKYPAESRVTGATSDTARGFNYVVFDENAITIEEQIQLQKALDKAGVSLTTAGFVYENDVYLNIQNSNILNTALHEHGHLLLNLLEANRPDVLEAGFGLISKNKEEAKSYIDYVKETQPSLVEGTRAFNHEVLAQVIGDSGQRLIESKKKNSLSNWLSELFEVIKDILGISNYTAEQVSNMTLEEFGRSVNAEMLSGENARDMISKAERYFKREADRLPLTLAVFNTKPFQDLVGKNVKPITVKQLLNKTGIKQIEKDLINEVLDKSYVENKQYPYDQIEAAVRANIMPLERLTTTSYSDTGMDNLGDGDYGKDKTLILNAPIEHGIVGHFPTDFTADKRGDKKYVAKQLDENTWVAVEEGYESQANDNNIYQFVGTAGTKEAVDSWIKNQEERFTVENTTVEESYISYILNQNGKRLVSIDKEDLPKNASKELIHNALLTKVSLEDIEINKGMFGHIRVWEKTERDSKVREESNRFNSDMYSKYGDSWQDKLNPEEKAKSLNFIDRKRLEDTIFYAAELQSDFFQKNNARIFLLNQKKSQAFLTLRDRKKSSINSELSEVLSRMYELGLPQGASTTDHIAFAKGKFDPEITALRRAQENVRNIREWDTIEEQIDEKEKELLDLTIKRRELLSEREKLVTYAFRLDGSKELEQEQEKLLSPQEKQFIASQKEWEKRMVREVIREAALSGATKLRFPTPYTLSVIEGYVNPNKITKVPYMKLETISSNEFIIPVNVEDNDLKVGDIINFGDLEYYYVVAADNNNIKTIPKIVIDNRLNTIESVKEKYKKILDESEDPEKELRTIIRMKGIKITGDYLDVISSLKEEEVSSLTETFGQPSSYKSTNFENFKISDLENDEQTVAKKYEEIAKILAKERSDVEVVKDSNGFPWYETKIAPEEVNNPVIAFQKTYSSDPKLESFFDALAKRGTLEVSPINRRELVYNGGQALLEINRFDKQDRDEIYLQDISTPEKGVGNGTKTMQDIVSAADELGYKVTLEAKPFGNDPDMLEVRPLVNFYEKFGFKVDLSAYGGDFTSKEEMIQYAEDNPSESVPMFRETTKTYEFANISDVKMKKGGEDRFIFDGEYDAIFKGNSIGTLYFNADDRTWRDPNYIRKDRYDVYGDLLGYNKTEALQEVVDRYNESIKDKVKPNPSTKINKVSSILDFDINFMDQYDEKEVGDINQDINECG